MSGISHGYVLGTTYSIAATTTPSNGLSVVPILGGYRCYNQSTTEWARILFSSDPPVIGNGTDTPPFAADKAKYGVPIPPGDFIDYDIIGSYGVKTYVSAWMEAGTGTVEITGYKG